MSDSAADGERSSGTKQLAADVDALRLSERSCRFVTSPGSGSKAKAGGARSGKKNRHATDPLVRGSSRRKQMSLSSSDSHLARQASTSSSASTSSACVDGAKGRKKALSVSGSNVNIPVAFPSSGHLDESVKSPKTPEVDLTPSGSRGANRGQRTPKKEAAKGFETYMMLDQVQQGLKKGELIEGVLRINPKKYQDAYISVPGGQMDICLGGIADRNRALNGDVVVVQLKPTNQWRILLSDLRNYLLRNSLVAVEFLKPLSSPNNFKASASSTNKSPSATRSKSSRTPSTSVPMPAEPPAVPVSMLKKSPGSGRKRPTRRGGRNKKKKLIEQMEKELETSSDEVSAVNSSSSAVKVPCEVEIAKSSSDISKCSANFSSIRQNLEEELELFTPKTESEHILPAVGCENCILEPGVEVELESSKAEGSDELLKDGIKVPEPEMKSRFDEVDNERRFESKTGFPGANLVPELGKSEVVSIERKVLGEEVVTKAVEKLKIQSSDEANEVLESELLDSELELLNADVEVEDENSHFNEEIEVLEDEIDTELEGRKAEECLEHGRKVLTSRKVSGTGSLTGETNFERKKPSFDNGTNIPKAKMNAELGDVPDEKRVERECERLASQNEPEVKENGTCLSDIYYPGLNCAVNNAVPLASGKNFDWAKVVMRQPLEELTVEDILKVPNGPKFVQPTAKVVYIVRRSHNSMARGHLAVMPDNSRRWAVFKPEDHRFPLLRIAASNCPEGFFEDPARFSQQLYVGRIKQWDRPGQAVGTLCWSVGSDCDLRAETMAVLIENGVDTQEFADDILGDLSWKFPFQIQQSDMKFRRDFRSCCVFTIDPVTARDLDDAISCEIIDENLLKVGVHIADVSHFVPAGCRLDLVASRRATSVYMPSYVIPMLPRELCEKLCSLRSGEDKLTFSVEWTIRRQDGAILEEWFGKSAIKSAAQLSYKQAQNLIHDEPLETRPEVASPWTIEDLQRRLKTLFSLTKKLRAKREGKGALRLDQSKLAFNLDSEGFPVELCNYKLVDSNRLIEELMLLANIAVARRIFKAFPKLAALRNHPPPVKRALDEVVDTLRPYGILLDSTSSHSLQQSLNRYYGEDDICYANHQLITHLLTKPMKLAAYFCSGAVLNSESSLGHYALSVPLYTHFTSPIRRYPDILVHRLLQAALTEVQLPENQAVVNRLQMQLAHCNEAKTTAKAVSDKSAEIYLTAYVRKLGSYETDGIICGLMDQSFDVLLYRMSLVKRVYCNSIKTLNDTQLEEQNGGLKRLKLQFNDDTHIHLTLFTRVRILLMVSEENASKLTANLQCVL